MASKRNKRSTASMAIAQAIINEYQPKNAEEMQEAIKDIFGPMDVSGIEDKVLSMYAKGMAT